MKNTPVFEYKTCGRCGGSGSYSYCTMYGSVCFGCSGKGYKLTSRGSRAFMYYRQLLSVPVESLQVGDIIQYEDIGISGSSMVYFVKITKTDTDELNGNLPRLTVARKGVQVCVMTLGKGQMVRKAQSGEYKVMTQAEAVEFQSKLTPSGKIKKCDITLAVENQTEQVAA